MMGFDLGLRHIGDGAPCLIMGEVGQAHDGSLTLAHAYIDAVARTGADAVKFQCHLAAAENIAASVTSLEPDRRRATIYRTVFEDAYMAVPGAVDKVNRVLLEARANADID